MPIRLEITNITKPNRRDPHSRIEWAGNLNSILSGGFKDAPANIARCINAGTHEFYVRAGAGLLGRLVEVPVLAMPPLYPGGEPYIRTATDFTKVDNLLSLPEFPLGHYALPLPLPVPVTGMIGGVNRLAEVLRR
jgi:Protein of unknown function (DUF3892)